MDTATGWLQRWEPRSSLKLSSRSQGVDMDIRSRLLFLALLAALPVGAQIHTATGPKSTKPVPTVRAPAHNSMSRSTTPFNCEQYRWPKHPRPDMKAFCDGMEADTLRAEARRAGRPGPSDDVVRLPALGSPEATRTGLACVGGQAMRKILLHAQNYDSVSH